jgi:Fe(3+) dicitrate transport protein
VNDWVSIYGGVHRGFVPPGLQDAIVGGGENLSMKPQYSWNYEAGVRSQPRQWLRYEATAFYIDYVQQLLDPSVVTTTTSGSVASGSSKSYGFEGSGGFDFASMARLGFELPLSFSYTYAQAQFGTGWGPGVQGNVVPYIPKHTLSTRLDFAHPVGLEAQFSVDHMSSRFTDPHNVVEATLDGTAGVIGANTVCNLRLGYKHRPWKTTFFAEARNLFDARYISSRAPDGIQPGMTRQVFGGVRFEY